MEAYLLWLFGWVLFMTSHHDTIDKHLVHYTVQIAYSPLEVIPQYSWGSAVLVATYRALCDACTRRSTTGTLAGCPLMVMLWSFERFNIGRPTLASYEPYEDTMYTIDQLLSSNGKYICKLLCPVLTLPMSHNNSCNNTCLPCRQISAATWATSCFHMRNGSS